MKELKVKINKNNLLEALNKVKPGLASKDMIEQSTSFVFADGMVLTYNDEIAVSCPVDCELEGVVASKELLGTLGKFKKDEVIINTTDSELQLKQGPSEVGIALETTITLPLEELGKPKKYKPLPKEFVEGLAMCTFSASTDLSKPILTCIHVVSNVIESCDNYRATIYDLELPEKGEEWVKEDMLIPNPSIQQLIRYTPIAYCATEGWVHFKCEGDVIFSCRTFEGEYPDVTELIQDKGVSCKLPSNLDQALDRASVFSKAEFAQDEHVKITISGKQMTVEGKGTTGWSKDPMRIKDEGTDLEFSINPKFLSQIIKKVPSVVICESTLLFSCEEFSHVIALVG